MSSTEPQLNLTPKGLQVAKQSLLLFLPLFTLLTLVMLWFYHDTRSANLLFLKEQNQDILSSIRQHIELSLNHSQNDLDLALKITESLADVALDKEAISQAFYQIVASREAYIKQLRFIGIDGSELVRVENIDGKVVTVSNEFLQNKAQRYYVQEGLKLRRGQVYQSPLDLNIEFGTVEFPYRPMIRFVAPVFDSRTVMKGIVVLNFNAGAMLSELNALGESSKVAIWLLNNQGYWIYDRHQEREWGFMFNDSSLSVAAVNPDIWQLITNYAGSDAQFDVLQEDTGLISIQRWLHSPRILLKGHNEFNMPWTAVAYYSPQHIDSLFKDLQQRYLGLLVISAFPILSLSVGFAVLFRRREELSRSISKLEEMREADNKFRVALDASPTPMLMVDHEQNIVLANREALKLFEFSSEEDMFIPLTTLIPDEFKKRHIQLVESFQKAPEVRRMAPIREVKAVTKTGQKISVEIGLNPVATSNGVVTLASINDITHRKMLESQLAKSNRTMMLAINTARVGVWTWVVGEEIMMWDDRMYKIYDFVHRPLRPITFQEWRDKIHPEDVARVDRVFERALRSNESQQYEFRVYAKDGQISWIKAGVVRELTGDATRLVGINIDVTEERMSHQSIATINRELERRVTQRTQELQQANRELEAFSYAVSHDLRTPLRGIDGFSNLLLKSLDDKIEGKDKEYLYRIRTAAQRMGELIDDMLTLSRITRADVVRKRVDLAALGKNIFQHWQELEPDRSVEFIVPLNLYANADSALMRIVLNNLISNAWKFTSKVDKAVIELGNMVTPEGEVFFIKDNGAGFDMEYVSKLFGAFQRLHTNSEFPGNGIGLATVQRVIEKHEGKIWAEGYVNRGATIFFTLPKG